MEEKEIYDFLNTLDGYYVFGGKALSNFVKGVRSQDWDVMVDSKLHNIGDVREKLRRVFGNAIKCKDNAFTRARVGHHSTIYGCTLYGEDVIDIKFEDIDPNTPIVEIDGITYLDIEGLYRNLRESIEDNMYTLQGQQDKIDTMNNNIRGLIREEIDDIEEMLRDDIEDMDEDEIQEHRDRLRELRSPGVYNEMAREIGEDIGNSVEEINMAKRLIDKNNRRLGVLLDAIRNPVNFRSRYLSKLCSDCIKTNSDVIRIVDGVELRCNKLCQMIPYRPLFRI